MFVSDILFSTLFPRTCRVCGKNNYWICPECRSNWQQPVVPNIDGFDIVLACVPYDNLAQKIMHDYKFNFYFDYAADIAFMMNTRLQAIDYDYLIPVPASNKRTKWRGFQHTELLCKHINIKKLNNVLIKTKDTRNQAELSKADRKRNLSNAFSLTGSDTIKDKRIVLVDDVCTTGSTLAECAQVLKTAGAKSVIGLVWTYTLENLS
ncbi:MAG: Ribose-phosphate pyrophosphokinase [candidate division WS6 bacterium OLB21]|uniref:Ribose-phosphate pyrophosphokinase n=1 Tax=candidate division WS6 bacterium OLB21 TaxID=1617427 RepID=A0A136KHS1_9BACT|nr:MAG: Ribose-phosphate pyrophosphokinase [candidate division WS6 bacterium OLB21]